MKHAPWSNMSRPAVHSPNSGVGTACCLFLRPVPSLLLNHPNLCSSWSSHQPVSTLYQVFFPSLFHTPTYFFSSPVHIQTWKECKAEGVCVYKLSFSNGHPLFFFFLKDMYIIATKWLFNSSQKETKSGNRKQHDSQPPLPSRSFRKLPSKKIKNSALEAKIPFDIPDTKFCFQKILHIS